MTDIDVAIIGGGVSGLAVLAGLTDAGVEAQLFEARPSLGGRIRSVEVPGGHADLGPTWFWPGEARVEQLVSAFNIPTHDQWSKGDALFVSGGRSHRVPSPPMVPSYRFTTGAGSLIQSLSQRSDPSSLHLNTPIVRLERNLGDITVHTANGSITASRTVIALPPALAMHRSMLASTDLEPEVGRAAAAMPVWMGGVTKVVAVYERPFWRDLGLSGMVSAPGHAFSEIHDMSGPDGAPAMLFGFARGREPRSKTADAFVEMAAALFGGADTPTLVRSLDWSSEEFTTVDAATENADYGLFGTPLLQRPSWDGALLWSSTETASTAPGHIEGALEAANRTCRALLGTDAS